jgi:hypothetical protein
MQNKQLQRIVADALYFPNSETNLETFATILQKLHDTIRSFSSMT